MDGAAKQAIAPERLKCAAGLLGPARFADAGVERAFRAEYDAASVRQQRIMAVIGSISFAACAVFYVLVDLEHYAWVSLVHMAFIGPGLAVLGGSTLLDVCRRHNQLLITAGTLAIFLPGLALTLKIAPPSYDLYLRPGVVLTIVCMMTALRLRFVYAFIVGLIYSAWMFAVSSYLGHWHGEDLMSMSSTILECHAICLYIAWQLEASARVDFSRRHELVAAQEKSERLLLNILPGSIAERLKVDGGRVADRFEEVTVLFADLVGFTEMAAKMTPEAVVALLDSVFSRFDELAERLGVEKIKTIGDAYMVVAGLPERRADHAQAVARMALGMLDVLAAVNVERGTSLSARIGINTGPVVAGVIGTKKMIYDLWGDTVNLASRMESHGSPGTVQVTEATRLALGEGAFTLVCRGPVQVKGKGEMVTWWLRPLASVRHGAA